MPEDKGEYNMTKQDNHSFIDDKLEYTINRVIWPDILRIVAVFAVIVIHSSEAGFDGRFDVNTSHFQICNIYFSMVRFAVPVFVMISGIFLLDSRREYSLKKLYFTKIFRIGIVYLLWAAFYSLIDQYETHHAMQIRGVLSGMMWGHYHLWFLFMICGLYIATPILRWISQNDEVCVYFIVIAFISVFCCNALTFFKIGKILTDILNRLDLKIIAGFSTYFLLGNYLARHKIEKKLWRHIIYIIGIGAVVGTAVFNGIYCIYSGQVQKFAFSEFLPTTFITAVSLFIFCQSFFSKVNFTQKQYALISLTAKLSFGIYLIHAFFLEHLHLIGMPDFFIHPLVSIPITSSVTFALSFGVAFVLNQIPFFRKYAI